MDTWKDIEGYEGIYQINKNGLVRSLSRDKKAKGHAIQKVKGILRKRVVNKKSSYEQVLLFKDAKGVTFMVHRLVAKAFIPNPENKPCINHIDSNRQNNAVENLEWCTHKENMEHCGRSGRTIRGEQQKQSKLKDKDVREIRVLLSQNRTQRQIARKFNISKTTIGKISRNTLWKHVN